ncbi:MAG: hypothetical protein AAGI17_09490 [Planctomycetota bacterium]
MTDDQNDNTSNHDGGTPPPVGPVTDEELQAFAAEVSRDRLLSRVVDGEATPTDFAALRELAAQDQAIWSDLSGFSADRDLMEFAVEDAGDRAARVDAVAGSSAAVRTVVPWAGWAAAIAVAALAVFVPRGELPDGTMQSAGIVPVDLNLTSDEALDQYLELGQQEGRVVAEWPEPFVLETNAVSEDGSVEVVYLRQILERRVINEGYSISVNEWGEPVAVPEPPAAHLLPAIRRAKPIY